MVPLWLGAAVLARLARAQVPLWLGAAVLARLARAQVVVDQDVKGKRACPNATFVLPAARRPERTVKADSFLAQLVDIARNASALEIGGPTTSIKGLYGEGLTWRGVDIVNVSPGASAVYETASLGDGGPREGSAFYAGSRQLGTLIMRRGDALTGIGDGAYDVVMAFHVLEHFADPLGALREWDRVLRPGGAFVLSVPWAPATYDRRVPVSTIYDLVLDSADDLNAYRPEIAGALAKRAEAYNRLVVADQCENCPDPAEAHENAGYHWHVYDLSLLEDAMACLGYAVEHLSVVDNWHQFVMARKPGR